MKKNSLLKAILVCVLIFSFLTSFSGYNVEAATKTSRAMVNVDIDSKVNIRSKPSTDSKILEKWGNGKKVKIYSKKKDWSEVRTSKGKKAYVNNKFLLFTPNISINAASAYYKKVNELIKKYGIYTGDQWESYGEKGLFYLELIDFDNNKVPELYLVYGKGTSENGTEGIIEEVWNYKGKQIVKIHKKEFDNGGLVSDASRTLTFKDNTTYLEETGYYSHGESDGIYEFERHNFYKLINNKFVEVCSAQFTRVSSEEDGSTKKLIYEIQEKGKRKNVSKKYYNQVLTNYNYNKRISIIDSSAGSKAIGFSAKNNRKTINEFVQFLKDNKK